jgi:hypothetical protein
MIFAVPAFIVLSIFGFQIDLQCPAGGGVDFAGADGTKKLKSLRWLFWLCCFLSKGHAPHHRNRSLRRHRGCVSYHRRQEHRLPRVIGRAAWPTDAALPIPAMNVRRLFDHLVGGDQNRRRKGYAERFGRIHVDRQREFCRPLDRQIGRLVAL